jgi:hypothetical protein
MSRPKTKESIESKVISSIYGHGRGWCFSRIDFSSIGSRNSIDFAIHRLHKRGVIRKIVRGIYDYPRYSKILEKNIAPDIDKAAHAIARKFDWDIQPNSATAQNYIGLSDQVPGRYEYLSNGPSRTYEVSSFEINFKKTTLKESLFKFRESSLIVQAIRGFNSKDQIDEKKIEMIKNWLPNELKGGILKDTSKVTGWVYEIIQKICNGT